MTKINVTASNVGVVVVGDVNQSDLRGSVNKLVQSGHIPSDAGQHIDKLIDVVGKMAGVHAVQQKQLLDLLKGLTQQLDLKPEQRSPSTIETIWEKIVSISHVSAEVLKVAQEVGPSLLPLLLPLP